jgi:ribosomal protein S12 methylthiotransferase accessory factor
VLRSVSVRIYSEHAIIRHLLGRLREDEFLSEQPATANRKRVLILDIGRADEIGSTEPEYELTDTLQVSYWRHWIYVGPFRSYSGSGCGRCLLSRTANSSFGPDLDSRGQVQTVLFSSGKAPILPPAAMAATAVLTMEQVKDWLAGSVPKVNQAIFVIDSATGAITFERLVPDSSCQACGGPAQSTIPQMSLGDCFPALRYPSFRVSDTAALADSLEGAYVQPHVGVVKQVAYDLQSPFASCTVELREGWGQTEFTIGRSLNYKQSRAISILEALERHCGLRRDNIGGIVNAPFTAISENAIYPPSLGLHPVDCYRSPNYPVVPFNPELPIDWVWGYSLTRRQPVLVPASVAFYGYILRDRPNFVCETSSGCAVGSSLHEATVHAVLELVERDSFLMTWYRKLSLPELSLVDLRDDTVRALLRKAGLYVDCQFRAFLSTMEHGIASLVLVAVANEQEGPCVMACGGAHPQLLQALKSAVFELTGLVMRLRYFYLSRRREALLMLDDPERVKTIEDHPLVNSLPEARGRFDFLLNRDLPRIALDEVSPPSEDYSAVHHPLATLLRQLTSTGFEVIVVDQTTQEVRAAGLHCVKAIVPGLLPMTFGHRFRRVQLARLTTDKITSIYQSEIRSLAEIGEIPHPFP